MALRNLTRAASLMVIGLALNGCGRDTAAPGPLESRTPAGEPTGLFASTAPVPLTLSWQA